MEKIYDFVEDKLSKVHLNLQKIDERNVGKEQNKAKALKEAERIFKECEVKAHKEIKDLKSVGEFKTFTIAFYGETNAGKSTIIESLRLYFNEATKQKQRAKFKQNYQMLEKMQENITRLENELKILQEKYALANSNAASIGGGGFYRK